MSQINRGRCYYGLGWCTLPQCLSLNLLLTKPKQNKKTKQNKKPNKEKKPNQTKPKKELLVRIPF